ncbi:MAG: DUF692 domain-containing protein [Kofleriaceae bacterium]
MYGIGLRTAHYSRWLDGAAPAIDFIEAITENFATRQGRPWAVLKAVRDRLPVAFHGVSLSLGGTDPLDREYIRAIGELASAFEPMWISDHLCYGSVDGHHSHDLWPLPRTKAMVEHVAERILRVQDTLGRRILIENVSSYVQYQIDEMSESEFVVQVLQHADCDLLLDVNNVVVNAYNHGFDAGGFIAAIPPARVKQLHLAGHGAYETHLFDDHRGPIPPSVWSLFQTTVEHFGEVPTLIEWDKDVPELEDVVAEATKARAFARAVIEPPDRQRSNFHRKTYDVGRA